MSWEKQTVNFSKIDSHIEIFKLLNYPYRIENTVKVRDDGFDSDEDIQLRALYFTNIENINFVIVEKMRRTPDCDSDDAIESITMKESEFNKENFQFEYMEEWE